MIIKLDMKNAFDHVNLSFLYQVVLSFGFSVEFVSLIKSCTNRPWIEPLVNGRDSSFYLTFTTMHSLNKYVLERYVIVGV